MSYKIKHYVHPVSVNVHSIIEVAAIEFSVGLICAGMAFWSKDIVIHLSISCAVVAFVCFGLTLHNIVIAIKSVRTKRKEKRCDNKEKTTKVD